MTSTQGTVELTNTQQNELIETISSQLYHYQVGFVRISKNKSSEDAVPAGSGTLVEIDGIYGILTAQHVIDGLPKDGDMGLIISSDVHQCIVKSEFLEKIKIAKGEVDSEGPDLGIIVLPHPVVGQIKAIKSFYNLSLWQDKILSNTPKNHLGIWFLCGIPAEMVNTEEPSKGFKTVKSFTVFCGAAGVDKEYTRGEYDYLEVDAHYNEVNQIPISFQGISGGGLWQVTLKQYKGKLEADEMILSGVVFYQSPLSNNLRSLKCHGRKSVYQSTIDIVKNIYNNSANKS